MDTEATTTFNGISRGRYTQRDHGAPRRAFLDTYAKRRTGITEVVQSEPKVVPIQPAIQKVAPVQAVQAPTSTKPISKPTTPASLATTVSSGDVHYMQVQPSSDSYVYTAPEPKETEYTALNEVPSKNYIDTLNQRYRRAVAQAPQAEETVSASQLDVETDSLFDMTEVQQDNEAKIEANLQALYSGSLTEQIANNTSSTSAAHVRTIVASALACGVMAVGIFTFFGNYNSQAVVAQPIGAPVIEVESSNSQTPSGTPLDVNNVSANDVTTPVRLAISSIGVNAPVESLGTTPEGLIAVPESYGVVGWYNKSATPGKKGPSVLVGHYTSGNNGVFDNLSKLKDGDLITTTNQKGQNYTYRVTAKNEYDRKKVPMKEIFKGGNESRLEIITCAGKWEANTYNNRLVITAELVK